MCNKLITITLMLCVTTSVQSKTNNQQESCFLQIYLPRKITIKHNVVNLGQISIMRGDEHLINKASKISLGQIPLPGGEIVVDKSTILSRLACNGIPASRVTLNGADKIIITRHSQVIKSQELVKVASSFLKKRLAANSIYQLNLVRQPDDLLVPLNSRNIKLLPQSITSIGQQRFKVKLAVLADDKKIGTRDVIFQLGCNHRSTTPSMDLPAGRIVNPANTKKEKAADNYPNPTNRKPSYGLVTNRRLSPGALISDNMANPAEHPIIIKRNQSIVIRVEKPGLLVTAMGKAIQDGRVGDYIKVRNVDSQRIIIAKVNQDGTVEPIF